MIKFTINFFLQRMTFNKLLLKKCIMGKRLSYFYIVLFCLIFTIQPVTAENIRPFGGLEWNDSFIDVVGKIHKIDGLEEIELIIGYESIDIKDISDKNSLLNKLIELSKKYIPSLSVLFEPSKPESEYTIQERIRIDLLNRGTLKKYKGKNGVEKRYIPVNYQLYASPVNILDVPFGITVDFVMRPGIDIVSPEKVLNEQYINISFPLVIAGVRLYSTSESIKDKIKEINNTIVRQYKHFEDLSPLTYLSPNQETGSFRGFVVDEEGGQVKINANIWQYSINYRNDSYPFQLENVYRKHLDEIESKNNSEDKDIDSD